MGIERVSRFRAEGLFRTWLDGQSEPATWAYSGSDASLSAPGRIFASLVRGSSNVGVKSVTLDDLVLTRG